MTSKQEWMKYPKAPRGHRVKSIVQYWSLNLAALQYYVAYCYLL